MFISPSFSSPTCSTNNDILISSTRSYPKLQAENLIRGLNLFPKHSINTPENDPHFVHGNIVEKEFTFPGLVDSGPSVEELGHHAGYYRLPHSKAAR
jgi:serine carboxypeptidase-like clade 4